MINYKFKEIIDALDKIAGKEDKTVRDIDLSGFIDENGLYVKRRK